MPKIGAIVVALLGVATAIGCTEASDEAGADGLRLGEPVSETRFDPVEASDDAVQQSTSSATGDTLCAPCTSNAACGTGNYCINRSDGVRFCGRDCRAAGCPSGYSCLTLGANVVQCVPANATCAGSTAADAGAATDAGVADAGGASATDDVPATTRCAAAAQWDAVAAGHEKEVLRLVNLRRQAGASCGGVPHAQAKPLTMAPALRCAARLHSRDMSDRGFFAHTTPDGVTFSVRIDQAGYVWRTVGENIASGYPSPQAVVDGWIRSPGHCKNIMNPAFSQLGVGLYGAAIWTQDFGAPL